MTTSTILALLAALLGGAALATQAPINSALAVALKSPLTAAAVSFGVGFAILIVLVVVFGDTAALRQIGAVNPLLFVGGALGAFYVWRVIFAVPSLGVVSAISAVVLGQLAAALMLDAIGPFGLQAIAITWQRVAGIGLVVAGLVLSRL